MSPASSGTLLEVEKYIGACLISHKQSPREVFYVQNNFFRRCGGVAGMPLISFAHQPPRRTTPPQNSHLHHPEDANRLAGAPLILSSSRRNTNFARNQQRRGVSGKSVDAASVTSDESSSTASDNSLPRIIKPRKRRKKERKNQPSSSSASTPDISPSGRGKSEVPFVFKSEVLSETPQLHHSFEDVEEVEETREASSVCQCRYCDPSGQIWDVERSCYSPFLFGESLLPRGDANCLVFGMSSLALEDEGAAAAKRGDLEVSSEIVTSLNGHRDLEIKFFSAGNSDGVKRTPGKNLCASYGRCVTENCAFVCEE